MRAEIHAIQMGPAADLNRVRTSKHGKLTVRGKTLLFVGNDGKQVSLSLDHSRDLVALANELREAAGNVALTEISISFADDGEEFVSDKAFPK